MTQLRPVPDDLAIYAHRESMNSLMARYRASKATIRTWMMAAGIERKPMRGGHDMLSRPADFADHYRETITQLRARYGVGDGVITRWRRELGGVDLAVAPADFAVRFQTLTIDQLRKHYQRGWATIQRWIRELGLERAAPIRAVKIAKPQRPEPVQFQRQAPEKRNPRAKLMAFHRATPEAIIRDTSQAGQAADFLRRFGPVYRCDVRGRPLADGFFWRRGNAVLTDDELIERADWMRGRQAA